MRGITWEHPRAYPPLEATARAFTAEHPGVRVAWEARSLQAFAEQSIAELAGRFDLIVLDHPWMGQVAAEGTLAALDTLLPAQTLAGLRAASVGASFASYEYDGHLWALAIDAAAQVAAYRPDVIDTPPRDWDGVWALADALRADGRRLAVPLIPVDCMMCFLSLCAELGEPPSGGGDRLVSAELGAEALGLLRRLRAAAHAECGGENPIAVLDRMAASDATPYCPLVFGYSNYARAGFRETPVRFAAPPGDGAVGPVLGGAGIAVSARAADPLRAAAFASFATAAEIQAGVYVDAGGQPGHRAAWTDARVDALASGFFGATLGALDRAYLRPRFDGFPAFQEEAGALIHAHLFAGAPADETLRGIESRFASARQAARR